MSKLEDNVNEILGLEKKKEVSVTDFEQPKPVPKVIDETKSDVDSSNEDFPNLLILELICASFLNESGRSSVSVTTGVPMVVGSASVTSSTPSNSVT